MTFTSSLRFLYIFWRSGLLCAVLLLPQHSCCCCLPTYQAHLQVLPSHCAKPMFEDALPCWLCVLCYGRIVYSLAIPCTTAPTAPPAAGTTGAVVRAFMFFYSQYLNIKTSTIVCDKIVDGDFIIVLCFNSFNFDHVYCYMFDKNIFSISVMRSV